MHYILFYEYVKDMLERRAPYREEHLARIVSEREQGHVVMAGALSDPQPDDLGAAVDSERELASGNRAGGSPKGAAIVFEGVEPEAVESFAREDPYVRAGLVTRWRVEAWKLV